MSRPSVRSARLAGWIAVPVALIASGALVAGASYSAFSAKTTNPTNNWTAGTVLLEDDDAGTALFTVANLKPADTGSKCIKVTSNGTLPSDVRLYATGLTTTKALDTFVKIKVEQGTGGTNSASACTGFTPATTAPVVFDGTVNGLGTTATNFASGKDTWQTTGTAGESRVYKFTYTLDADTINDAQGGTAAIGFTWEAQNR